jgi:cell division protein FtsI/penicillin-binding protein 2
MEGLFKQYRPDYGAFVAMDASTGQILSIVSYSDKSDIKENMAFRATFPSASVFKVVTAAAAIENQKFSADTPIMFNGANHTLYKHNILKNPVNRWTRHATLKDAFAKSINTVFGRIGAFTVGPTELRTYADRFGFNRQIQADFLFQQGKAPIPDDAWGIAEAASGYTRDNTMSPMQGALIAATIVNEGVMMEPYLVQSVFTPEGTELYSAKPKVAQLSIEPSTAAELRRLMRETVVRGTSRKSFRGFERSKFADINVGGKTGSLTGTDPQGKYDWFVAFAEGRGRRIAFASLTIHQKLWRVKSSYLVRRAIEAYFKKDEATAGKRRLGSNNE